MRSEETSWCPECQSGTLESLDEVGSVCRECGYLLDDQDQPLSQPTPETKTEKKRESISWSDYYTVSGSTEKQVAEAYEELEDIADDFGVSPTIRETAAEIYAEAAIDNITDGRSTRPVVAAAVVLATRCEGEPRPVGWAAESADVDEGSLAHFLRVLLKELGRPITVSHASEYVSFIGREVGIRRQQSERAERLTEMVTSEMNTAGRNPVGFAAAAVYLVTDSKVTMRMVAQTSGITKETVRVRLLESREVLKRS